MASRIHTSAKALEGEHNDDPARASQLSYSHDIGKGVNMTKHKQDPNKRPGFISFVTGWAAAYLVASVAMMIMNPGDSQFYTLYSDLWTLLFAGIIAGLQFLWLRRSWGITLRLWLPLALLGVIVGEAIFELFAANVEHPFPPKLWANSPNRMPEPEHIMQLKYTLYNVFRFFLIWSTPLIFQWLTLRKRFAGHGLWLLAAVVHAPLSFFIAEHGGIAIHALKFCDQFTEISLIRDAQPLGSLFSFFDMALPTAIMGFALFELFAKSSATGHLRSPVKNEHARLAAARSEEH